MQYKIFPGAPGAYPTTGVISVFVHTGHSNPFEANKYDVEITRGVLVVLPLCITAEVFFWRRAYAITIQVFLS